MSDSAWRPLLFLDVDGPLIPFGATSRQLPGGYRTYPVGPGMGEVDANPLLDRLDPALGPRLLMLGCELVWATAWTDDANEWVGPRIGLPQLPVVLWPEPSDEDGHNSLHWKTRSLLDWVRGQPFVWVDDEITDTDRDWVAAHYPEPALLHRVDSAAGLIGTDFAVIDRWLRAAQRKLSDAL
ncbi:HAD domain-containing protein [Streptacidiphilus sp. PAMC 29251]